MLENADEKVRHRGYNSHDASLALICGQAVLDHPAIDLVHRRREKPNSATSDVGKKAYASRAEAERALRTTKGCAPE
jgi:hypothetical protein